MNIEILIMVGAIVVALIALLLSPLVRAICWDAFMHPRYRCKWVREGKHIRELKAGIDYPVEE